MWLVFCALFYFCVFTVPRSLLWCPIRFPHENDARFVFTSSCLFALFVVCVVCCLRCLLFALFVVCVVCCLRCLLFTCEGVQHILCCVFVLFFLVLYLCCQFLWIVLSLIAPSVFSIVSYIQYLQLYWSGRCLTIMCPFKTR